MTATPNILPAWARALLSREASHALRLLRIAQTQPGHESSVLAFCLSGSFAVRAKLLIEGRSAFGSLEGEAYTACLEAELLATTRATPWLNVFAVRRVDASTVYGSTVFPPYDVLVFADGTKWQVTLDALAGSADPPARPAATAMLTTGAVPFWREGAPLAPPPPLPRKVRAPVGAWPPAFYAFPHQIAEHT